MTDKVKIEDLDLFYGQFQALKKVSLNVPEKQITAIIGPSGCGKSTLLRCLNRMNDDTEGVRITGRIEIDGQNILGHGVVVENLRQKVGMVFQRPNPFPMSVYDNVAYGPRIHGIRKRSELDEIVEKSFRAINLWGRIKDCLKENALELSLGDQQQLCLARLLAVESEVILLDEPCSALDPVSTLVIEELMRKLKEKYTIFIVTHNMQQAARASDLTAFMLLGDLVEYGPTNQIFTAPVDKRTEDYITGRFG